MLTTSVMFVLHEVLEAAFMVGALLALTQAVRLPTCWAWRALAIGLTFAALYGFFLRQISALFSGSGQEALNVLLQATACAALLVCVYLGAGDPHRESRRTRLLPLAMTVAVASAIALEGSEIFVYAVGFVTAGSSVSSAGIGSFFGLCIGISIGVLFYHLLQLLSPGQSRALILFFVILVATGMSAQATRELIQAQWLTAGLPLWDSSGFLPEDSITGQVLYALGGYEATPTAIELWSYLITLAVMIVALLTGRRLRY